MFSRDHTHSNYSDIEANNAPTEESEAKDSSVLWYTLYLLPIINMGNDASQVAMALRDASPAFKFTAVPTQALVSFSTDAAQTVKNFRETCQKLISKKHKPITGKMYAAGAAAATIATYVAASDSIEAWFYGESIPVEFGFNPSFWRAVTATMATSAGITALVGQSIYGYRYLIGKLHGTKYKYTNKLSSHVSPLVGSVSGVICAANSMLSAAIGTATVLQVKPPYFYGLAAATIFKGFARYVNTAEYLNESLDKTITTLGTRRPYASEVVSMIIALGTAGYLAYTTQLLAVTLLDDAAAILDVEVHAAVRMAFNVFSIVAAVNDGLSNTGCVFELATKAVSAVNNTLNGIYNKFAECRESQHNDSRIDNDNDVIAPAPVQRVIAPVPADVVLIEDD
jgi:hypothetical protein